jgi:selenocysteine lyase/cysteine desulfurase
MRLLLQHLRIGYVGFILAIDAAAGLLGVLDVTRFSQLGLSPAIAWTITPDDARAALPIAILSFLTFTIAIPVIIAVARVVHRGGRPSYANVVGVRHGAVTAVHILFSALASISYVASTRMEPLSGAVYRNGDVRYAFTSYYCAVVRFVAYAGAVAIIPILLGALGNWAWELMRSQPLNKWQEYKTRAELIDLPRIYFPTYRRARSNFNASAIGPEIALIRREADRLVRVYQESIPASSRSRALLDEWSAEAEEKVRSLVKLDPAKHVVQILPGTSRALEVAIADFGRHKKHLIFSPFEHESEIAVAQWAGVYADIRRTHLPLKPAYLRRPWSESADEILTGLVDAIKQAKNDNRLPIIVMSEVSWATGLVLPVIAIVDELRKRFQDKIRIVVDGAHVPGNTDKYDGLHGSDAYVLSTHKWLFAGEPGGILVRRNSGELRRPYDAWQRTAPVSTASVRAIAHLLAALQFVQREEWPDLKKRSDTLRNAFLSHDMNCLRVVGAETKLEQSLMLAVAPAVGWAWRSSIEGLVAFWNQKKVEASLRAADEEGNAMWARIAFPYFLELRDIELLVTVLEASMETK